MKLGNQPGLYALALAVAAAACAAERADEGTEDVVGTPAAVTVHAPDGHELTFLGGADHAVGVYEITSPSEPSLLAQHPTESIASIYRLAAPNSPVPQFLMQAELAGPQAAGTHSSDRDVIANVSALESGDFVDRGGCNECDGIANLSSYPHVNEYCHSGFTGTATDSSVGQEMRGTFNSREKAAVATVSWDSGFGGSRQIQRPLEPNQMLSWHVSGPTVQEGGVVATHIFMSLQGEPGAMYDMGMCVASYEDPFAVLGPQVAVGGP